MLPPPPPLTAGVVLCRVGLHRLKWFVSHSGFALQALWGLHHSSCGGGGGVVIPFWAGRDVLHGSRKECRVLGRIMTIFPRRFSFFRAVSNIRIKFPLLRGTFHILKSFLHSEEVLSFIIKVQIVVWKKFTASNIVKDILDRNFQLYNVITARNMAKKR